MVTSVAGRAAIVGAHESPRRSAPGVHPFEIHAECVAAALADAGLGAEDVDGLCTAAGDFAEGGAYTDVLDLADYLGVRPTYFDSTDVGGGSYVAHVGHAAAAIASGLAEVVVVSYAACPRWWPIPSPFWDGLQWPAGAGQFEMPYSMTLIGMFAMLARRHMHVYGTTAEQLAAIAVACRANAAHNPHARFRDPLTVEDVLESTMIASPLHKLDCCVVTDGGGAVVLTSAERALDCRRPPVWVNGYGEALGSFNLADLSGRLVSPVAVSGPRALAMAGLSPEQIDVAQLYDAFTITPLIALEDLGFCDKGDAGAFVAAGAIGPDGAIPINTDGGGLSSNHGGRRGMYALIEGVRSLRGESAGRQVADCRNAVVQGLGGIMAAATTVVLGVEAA